MEISYELQPSDLTATHAHLQARLRGATRASWRRILLALAAGLLIAAILPQAGKLGRGAYQPWVWLVTLAAFVGSALWLRLWRRSRHAAHWLEQFAGHYTLALTPAGVVSTSTAPGGRVSFRAWPEIVALEATEAHLYFYLRRDVAFAVPRAAFGDDAACAAFADQARALWAAHPDNAGRALPEAPLRPNARALWANLRGGARIIFLRDFDPHAFTASPLELFRLFALQLLCFGIFDYLEALPVPEFNSYGLLVVGAQVLLLLAAAASISGLQAQRATLLRLAVMASAATLALNLVYLPLYHVAEVLRPNSPRLHWAVYLAAVLWSLAAVFRIVRRLYRLPAPGALSHVAVFALFTLALGGLLPTQRLYYDNEPDDDQAAYTRAAKKLNVEDVFYRQPALVEQAVDSLAPQRPGKTDLYFVGLAGDGSEKVFANEVRYARDLMDRRFGTADRSVVLLNNPEATGDTPLANTHNLDAVLAGIAARMDRNQDVLFLFLSSHGAQDHRLSVSQWPLQLNDLRAEAVKEMLDRYGIRNRVIVVSACYSGGFLDVLQDDNTLVLTASSRNHVSYGCGDYTQYTYFGESYFVKALAHGDSFITAFDEARRAIEERENSEGQDHSRPQISVGRNIAAVLGRLDVAPVDAPSRQQALRASQPPALAERARRAEALEREPAVRDYMQRSMFPALTPVLNRALAKCVKEPNASSSDFSMVADIARAGALEQLDYAPATNTAQCVAAALARLHLPSPPEQYPTLPVVLDMHLVQ